MKLKKLLVGFLIISTLQWSGLIHPETETTQVKKKVQKKEKPHKGTPKKQVQSKPPKKKPTQKAAPKKPVKETKKTPTKTTKALGAKPKSKKPGKTTTAMKAKPITKSVKHDPKTGKFVSSKDIPTKKSYSGETATSIIGLATAGTAAATAAMTPEQKAERKAALTLDREHARSDTDWQRSKNIKKYDRYDKLRHETKDKRKQYGWRWLKAPWDSYAFWRQGCGWMYFDLDKNQWWIPCGGGYWSKTLVFEVGSESNVQCLMIFI